MKPWEPQILDCPTCEASFVQQRPRQVYCTTKCRNGAAKSAGSTTARGYGGAHQRERRIWVRWLDAGNTVECARGCGTVIDVTSTWDLGHTDDRSGWTGPECVPCNRSAGARNSNRKAFSLLA